MIQKEMANHGKHFHHYSRGILLGINFPNKRQYRRKSFLTFYIIISLRREAAKGLANYGGILRRNRLNKQVDKCGSSH